MVNIKITFIPSDGTPAKDFQLDNFDLAGVSGMVLRELLSEKVNVPANRLQLFCMGHTLEDTTMLIDLGLGKSAKVLASERVPSVLSSAIISSPVGSGTTPMPVSDSLVMTNPGTPGSDVVTSTSPPRTFSLVGSPLSTVRGSSGSASTGLFGSDITLTQYLQRLLPLAHVAGSTFEDAAKHPPFAPGNASSAPSEAGPVDAVIEQFYAIANSSIPQQQLDHLMGEWNLPHPIEGLPMTPERVALQDKEECQYEHLLQVRSQFANLPELTSQPNRAFATEVATLLGQLHDVLSGTKNAYMQSTAISIQQRITNPNFIEQYTMQKSHPIATNTDLVDLWERLGEARALMDSAKEAIDRSVYTDDVRVSLNNVISLAGDVETLVNGVLAKLERLRAEYKNFPAHEEGKSAEMEQLDQLRQKYTQLLADLKATSERLVQNTKTLKKTYDGHKEALGKKINSADRETLRLEKEQNLLLAAIDMLGRMYIEHEVERQRQLALSDAYTQRSLSLDEELKRFTSESMRHAERVSSATNDAQAALKAVDLCSTSVTTQFDLLQQWTDEAKSQHSDQGVRALHEAHHTAVVKFDALVEIWDSANRSLQEIQPEIVKLDAEILSASQTRTQIKVEVARKQKKEYEAAIPIYEKTRDDANAELEHLEKVLFPTLNVQLATYGQLPVPIPSRKL